MAEGEATVDSLPWEMLVKVLSYLDTHDLVETVPHVCQRWREASMKAQLWINRPFCPDEYYSHKEIVHCLKKMPELRHVKLFHPQHLCIVPFSDFQGKVCIDDILEALCKYCPKLESFAVEVSCNFSMKKMKTFITHSKKLSSLTLRNFVYFDCLHAAISGSRKIKHLSLEVTLECFCSKQVEFLKQFVKSASRLKSQHIFGYLGDVGILRDVLQTTSHVLTGMYLHITYVTDDNIVNMFEEFLNSFHSLHNLQLEVDGIVSKAYLQKFLHVVRHVLTELHVTFNGDEEECQEQREEHFEWVDVLSECHQLQSLKLGRSNALPNLGQLPSITSLSLCNINTHHDDLINLFLHGSWQQLKTLHIVGIKCLDNDAWCQIFTCCPNLQHINLTRCDLSLDCISNLVRYCPSVRELILSETNVSNFMLRYLYKLRCLELLSLEQCLKLTRIVVGDIIKCENVKILNLNYCSWLEDSAVLNILAVGNLEVLSILHVGASWTFLSSVKTVSKRLRKICMCICDYNEGEPVCKVLENVRLATLPCHREERMYMFDDWSESCEAVYDDVVNDYVKFLVDSDDDSYELSTVA